MKNDSQFELLFNATDVDSEKLGFSVALNCQDDLCFCGSLLQGILSGIQAGFALIAGTHADRHENSFAGGIAMEFGSVDALVSTIPTIYSELPGENERMCLYFALHGLADFILENKREWVFKLPRSSKNADRLLKSLCILAKRIDEMIDYCANSKYWNPDSNYLSVIAGRDWHPCQLPAIDRITILRDFASHVLSDKEYTPPFILFRGKLYHIKDNDTMVAGSLCKSSWNCIRIRSIDDGILAKMLEDFIDLKKDGIYSVASKISDREGNEYLTVIGPGGERRVSSSKVELMTFA